MDMQTNKARDLDAESKNPVPLRKIYKDAAPSIAQARQRRRTHAGGWLDLAMDPKSIPGLSFKGFGVPPMAIAWFFFSMAVVWGTYGLMTPLFRMLNFGVYSNGKNIWNGSLYSSQDPVVFITLAVLVMLLVLTNIEYIARQRVWILAICLWFTISGAIGSSWVDFYSGKVGLISPYTWNSLGNFQISPAPNWIAIVIVSAVIAGFVSTPIIILNWITKKLSERG